MEIRHEMPNGGSLYRFTSNQNIETIAVLNTGTIEIFDTKL